MRKKVTASILILLLIVSAGLVFIQGFSMKKGSEL